MIDRLDISSEQIVLKNIRVLDVERGELCPASNVFISGGRFADLDAPSPNGNYVSIDCTGLTLSPGLIDCHTHILSPYLTQQKGFPGIWTFAQMRRNFEATLACGVVAVRDMLSPINVLNTMKKKISSGKMPGPEIVASGGIFSCDGGYPEAMHPVPPLVAKLVGQPKLEPKTPGEARAEVRRLVKQRAGVIKCGYTSFSRRVTDGKTLPVIPDDVLEAICAEAHAFGLKVSVHHNFVEDLMHLIRFNIDSLEHIVFSRDLTAEEVSLVKKSGVTFVPTLTVNDSQARFEEKLGFILGPRANDYFEPQAHEHLSYVASTWTDFNGESYDDAVGHPRANRPLYATLERNARRLCEAGVPMLAGTDAGAVVAFPGEIIDELIRLNDIGMSKHAAIRAATDKAAAFLGLRDLGTIATGKKADVTIIDGNPLADLRAYRKVRFIGKSGNWYRAKHSEAPDFWPGHSILFQNAENGVLTGRHN